MQDMLVKLYELPEIAPLNQKMKEEEIRIRERQERGISSKAEDRIKFLDRNEKIFDCCIGSNAFFFYNV